MGIADSQIVSDNVKKKRSGNNPIGYLVKRLIKMT
jgi:hypothetical protein